jgi:hypothetical protein
MANLDAGRASLRISGAARVVEYVFGRNALIGIASAMLLLISGYATWAGMHDFIVGVSSSSQGRTAPGGVNVSHDNLVVWIVIALTFLMWLALRESFGAGRTWKERLITFPLYVFLALWSIGFGYGFWWSLIAGQEATRSGIAGLQEDARDAGSTISARINAVKLQIDSVVSWSDGQMSREETSGGSCGVTSGAGRGPLYNARRSVRDSITTLRDGVTKSWIVPTQEELKSLQDAAALPEDGSVEERQRRFEARASDIRGKSRSLADRSNALGKTTATEMRALAAAVSIQPNAQGFSCFDPTLAQRLRQAADQADQPATLTLREAAFNEGPAGTANAIKNLWQNMGSYTVNLVRYVFTGGTSGEAVVGGQSIGGRDMIALLATVGIDLGLFVLALLDPPKTRPERWDGLRHEAENIHQVSEQTKKQIREAIETAISRNKEITLEWVHGHFIHHGGASYYVIPNLFRVDPAKPGEQQKAVAMNQLAGVFSDMKLIRVMGEKELKEAGKEEARASFTDLNAYKEQFREQEKKEGRPVRELREDEKKRIRNHGLFSKAERALSIAGWSERAKSDVEVFRIVDVEGLTPLLDVLTDPPGIRRDNVAQVGPPEIAGGVLKAPPQQALPPPSDKG